MGSTSAQGGGESKGCVGWRRRKNGLPAMALVYPRMALKREVERRRSARRRSACVAYGIIDGLALWLQWWPGFARPLVRRSFEAALRRISDLDGCSLVSWVRHCFGQGSKTQVEES